jgi:hypothetical protein
VRGNLVETVIEQQFFGVPASRTVNSGSADARGLFPEKTFTVDTDGDGDVDSRQVTQTTFDARGNPVSSSTSFDDDNNGAIDSRYAFTDTFDANDHPRTEIFDSDSNADGVIDLRALTTYTQENPRSLVRVTTQDEGVDGVIDDRSTTRWRYDAAGNNTSIVFLDERGPEFTVYGTGEFTMTYDGDNRLLTEVRAQSHEDGVLDSTYSTTYVYDDQGNLTKATTRTTGSSVPSLQVVDYEYGPDGERTLYRFHTDVEGDGSVDVEGTTQITNQEFSDGVLMLAQQYFDFGENAPGDYTSGFIGTVAGN